MKLTLAILGLVAAICTGTIVYCNSLTESAKQASAQAVAQIDSRVRVMEQNDAANAARFEAIMQRFDRMEKVIK